MNCKGGGGVVSLFATFTWINQTSCGTYLEYLTIGAQISVTFWSFSKSRGFLYSNGSSSSLSDMAEDPEKK